MEIGVALTTLHSRPLGDQDVSMPTCGRREICVPASIANEIRRVLARIIKDDSLVIQPPYAFTSILERSQGVLSALRALRSEWRAIQLQHCVEQEKDLSLSSELLLLQNPAFRKLRESVVESARKAEASATRANGEFNAAYQAFQHVDRFWKDKKYQEEIGRVRDCLTTISLRGLPDANINKRDLDAIRQLGKRVDFSIGEGSMDAIGLSGYAQHILHRIEYELEDKRGKANLKGLLGSVAQSELSVANSNVAYADRQVKELEYQTREDLIGALKKLHAEIQQRSNARASAVLLEYCSLVLALREFSVRLLCASRSYGLRASIPYFDAKAALGSDDEAEAELAMFARGLFAVSSTHQDFTANRLEGWIARSVKLGKTGDRFTSEVTLTVSAKLREPKLLALSLVLPGSPARSFNLSLYSYREKATLDSQDRKVRFEKESVTHHLEGVTAMSASDIDLFSQRGQVLFEHPLPVTFSLELPEESKETQPELQVFVYAKVSYMTMDMGEDINL